MTIRDALGRWWVALVALAASAGLVWLMAAMLAPLTLGDVAGLQFVWDPAAFMTVLREWAFTYRVDRFVMHVAPDALLALAYGTLLASLISLALRHRHLDARWDLLLLVPVAAAVLDLSENVLQLWIMGAVLPEGAVPFAAAVSLAKWVAVGASVAIAVAIAIMPPRRDTPAGVDAGLDAGVVDADAVDHRSIDGSAP